LKDKIGPPTPNGYYIIILDARIKDHVLRKYGGKIIIEEYGGTIIVKTKSRSIANDLARRFRKYIHT
jgi:hypothetical protein